MTKRNIQKEQALANRRNKAAKLKRDQLTLERITDFLNGGHGTVDTFRLPNGKSLTLDLMNKTFRVYDPDLPL